MRKLWPLLMVFCFGILDAASTLYVYGEIGSFEYELGLLTNVLYDLGGIDAVVIFKLMLTTIAAILLYLIAESVPRLDNLCKLMCIGASIVGIFATLSNTTGALTGSTLWLFGLRGDMIAYMLFTLFFIIGIADLIMKGPREGRVNEIRGKAP